MTQNTNYGLLFEKTLESIQKSGEKPKLLLHSCCAPCSSSVLEFLIGKFDITLYFYNPNISTEEEYKKRLSELQRFVFDSHKENDIKIVDAGYTPDDFYSCAEGLENEKERGKRCMECYFLRLSKTHDYASENGFDMFCTTLSVSPHKDAVALNRIGEKLSEKSSVKWLYSDFKKKDGYKRSIELSKLYGLYRQNFCGCIYSAGK